ncbi:sporulation integral membrane protein YlbJ [Sediminibacillus massiliensis]|uniref:sporulation integral membrane protein YlbJ n=1 Tax=Sediminibacillus massiliensis TaxID=1926277 RepID=UPI003CCC10BA
MKSKIKSIVLAFIALFLAASLILYPDEALEASIRGLNMWWEIVFPSLLPFFITAELLIGFGVVRFIGILFEPIMRPLFNVPGVGSFVWAMGMASGYPSGAKLTTRLRLENQLTKTEAERLVSFTNASNPLFIFGAVSVGFFHDAKLGILLATCHYLGNTLVGICMRFYGMKNDDNKEREKSKISLYGALQALHRTRLEDSRPFGKIFGDAVINSIQTLLMIGGFIIMFSVFTKLIFLIGISGFFATFISIGFQLIGIPGELSIPFFSGLFEITLGAQMISHTDVTNLLAPVTVVCFILAFNGFSVQAQVASIIAESDISFVPYFFARLLHGLFASILAVILFKPLYLDQQTFEFNNIPVFSTNNSDRWFDVLYFLKDIGPLITLISLTFAVILLFGRSFGSK